MFTKMMSAAALGAALAVAGCATPYGDGGYGGTQLSQCMRNALIGAGVGAAAGAIAGDDDDRLEGAAAGAAVGGLGTYGVCRLLDGSERGRIEQAYQTALASNAAYQTTWTAADGSARALQINTPQPAPGQPGCRILSAQLIVSNRAAQALPSERFCPGPTGWTPA